MAMVLASDIIRHWLSAKPLKLDGFSSSAMNSRSLTRCAASTASALLMRTIGTALS